MDLSLEKPLNPSHPEYFIAVDDCKKQVILAIRGTFEIEDAITDLCAHTVPLPYMDIEGCQTHNGVYVQTMALYETCKEILIKQINQNKGYGLVITGHSLGGGSSVIM